jgi:hypothetical protein
MIHKYLLIRLRQIIRAVISTGIMRMIIFFAVFVLITLVAYKYAGGNPGDTIISALHLSFILYYHLKRQDIKFMRVHIDRYKLYILVEYLMYSLPVLIILLVQAKLIHLVSIPAILFIISNIRLRKRFRRKNTIIQRIIPDDAFEWKAGSRKTAYIFIILILAGLGTAFFEGSIPLVILIIGMIPLGFTDTAEPYQMVIAYELSTVQFLMHKIRKQVILFLIPVIPLILVYLIFHPNYWYIPLLELLILTSLQVYFVTAKYAFYESAKKSTAAQIYGAIGALSIFLPFMIPFVWIMTIRFFYKSKQKLNFYLHDFNT